MNTPKRTVFFDPENRFRHELATQGIEMSITKARLTLAEYKGSATALSRTAVRLTAGLTDRNQAKIAFNRAFLTGGAFAIHAAKPNDNPAEAAVFETDVMHFFSQIPNLYDSDILPRHRVDMAAIVAGETIERIKEIEPLAEIVEAVYERPDLPHLRDSLSQFALYGLTATADRLATISELLTAPHVSDLDRELAELTRPQDS